VKELLRSQRLSVHAKARSYLLYAAFELRTEANILATRASYRSYTTQLSRNSAEIRLEIRVGSSSKEATPLGAERQWSIRTSRNVLEAAKGEQVQRAYSSRTAKSWRTSQRHRRPTATASFRMCVA
jgi:hypothetical protein